MTYGGFPPEDGAYRPALPLNIPILAIWLTAAWLLGEVSERLQFHNGCLLAPIFFGAALTMGGAQLSSVSRCMTDFAQLMFGLAMSALFFSLQAFHPICFVELAFYPDRFIAGGSDARIGF
ncbi:MAG TPA: hypothetical protein VGH22_07665 [Candidatus Binatia bacterium]